MSNDGHLRIYAVAVPCTAYPHVFAASEEDAIEQATKDCVNHTLYDTYWGRVMVTGVVVETRDEG